jgi:hypothetical protein
MEPSMNIRSRVPKYLKAGMVALVLAGAALVSAPAVAQPFFSFGFGTGGSGFSVYSGNYPYPYWRYYSYPRYGGYYRPHRHLAFCERYPRADACNRRHYRHDYMRDRGYMMRGYQRGFGY